jgi:hypothetical protein
MFESTSININRFRDIFNHSELPKFTGCKECRVIADLSRVRRPVSKLSFKTCKESQNGGLGAGVLSLHKKIAKFMCMVSEATIPGPLAS